MKSLLQTPQLRHFQPSFFEQNRKRLLECFTKSEESSIIFLLGDVTISFQDSDIDRPFQQEANFYYLFGGDLPDCFGFLHLGSGEPYFFFPDMEDYRVWMDIPERESLQRSLGIRQVFPRDKLESVLNELKVQKMYTYYGRNHDSGHFPLKWQDQADLQCLGRLQEDNEWLYEPLNELRVFKSREEQEMLSYVVGLTCEAHVFVMQHIKPGMSQMQIEALYQFYMKMKCHGKDIPYSCICACGADNAKLHYLLNDKVIGPSDMVLTDMGTKYNGYCSDVTTSFPVNGKFHPMQRELYEIVLDMNLAVIASIKPGVNWIDLHKLAWARGASGLQRIGILQAGSSVEEIVASGVMYTFMPHGLGHFYGLLTHDVGGYGKAHPPRQTMKGLRNVRTARNLQKDMCVTVEPGLYFVAHLLEESHSNPNFSKFIDYAKVEEYRWVGGVRIEDDCLVTENGCLNWSACLPRTVEQIEKCMAGLDWQS